MPKPMTETSKGSISRTRETCRGLFREAFTEDQELLASTDKDRINELIERIETQIYKLAGSDQNKLYREKVNSTKTRLKVEEMRYC